MRGRKRVPKKVKRENRGRRPTPKEGDMLLSMYEKTGIIDIINIGFEVSTHALPSTPPIYSTPNPPDYMDDEENEKCAVSLFLKKK
jgi:hypothetical protein